MLFILLERSFLMKITVVVFMNLEICFSILKHLWDRVSLCDSCWTSTQLRWFEWQMPMIGLCVLTFASQVELFGGIPNLSAGRPNWRKCITEASLNDGESHSTSLSTSLYLACGLNIIAWNPAPVARCLAFPGLYGHSPSGIVAPNKLSSTTCFSQSVLRQH